MHLPIPFLPRRRHALLVIAVLALPQVRAEEIIELTPVHVIAHAGETSRIVVVDPRAPAQPIPAQDGAEALRAIPGFNVIRKGGTDGDPVLRGMAGSRLGILLDGENILGGCGNRMDPPTAYVFPAAYDRITVLKGPQSVAHGPGNSAGVVLFERMPRRLDEAEASLQGSLTFGSFGRNDQFIEARAGAPRGYGQLIGTHTSADDYSDGSARAVHSRYTRWSAHAAAGWTPEHDTLVELSGILSDGEAAYADRAMDGTKFARENLGLRLRRTAVSSRVESVEAQVFFNYVDHVMDNFTLREFTPTMMMPGRAVSNPDRRTFGGQASALLTPGSGLRLDVGADHQDNEHAVRSTRNQLTDPYEAKARSRDASFDVTGLYAEATKALGDNARLVGGARADLWSAHDHRSTIAVGMAGSAPNPTAGARRSSTLPSGFLRYEHDLRVATTAHIGLGHAQRFPDYWELFNKESVGSVSAFNTGDEGTTQLDLGISHRSGPWVASLALFASRIDDFILIESGVVKPAGMTGTRTATVARNVDASTRGGEAALAWESPSGWRADASVSWVYGDNRTDDRPLAQQPPLEGRLGLAYAASRWSVGGLARAVAGQERFALNQGNIVGQDLGSTPGFAVISLHAAWKPVDRAQLTAGVDNLFDRTYAEHLSRGGAMVGGFPAPTLRVNEPGRAFWLKLDLRY